MYATDQKHTRATSAHTAPLLHWHTCTYTCEHTCIHTYSGNRISSLTWPKSGLDHPPSFLPSPPSGSPIWASRVTWMVQSHVMNWCLSRKGDKGVGRAGGSCWLLHWYLSPFPSLSIRPVICSAFILKTLPKHTLSFWVSPVCVIQSSNSEISLLKLEFLELLIIRAMHGK